MASVCPRCKHEFRDARKQLEQDGLRLLYRARAIKSATLALMRAELRGARVENGLLRTEFARTFGSDPPDDGDDDRDDDDDDDDDGDSLAMRRRSGSSTHVNNAMTTPPMTPSPQGRRTPQSSSREDQRPPSSAFAATPMTTRVAPQQTHDGASFEPRPVLVHAATQTAGDDPPATAAPLSRLHAVLRSVALVSLLTFVAVFAVAARTLDASSSSSTTTPNSSPTHRRRTRGGASAAARTQLRVLLGAPDL